MLQAKYLTSGALPVKTRQLWGTDVYSDDSDLVAVLVHTGHVKLKASPPKTPLLVSLRVCPTQPSFAGSDRNGLKSRDWNGAHAGVAYKVERCLQHTATALPPTELSMLRPEVTRQIPGSLLEVAPGAGGSFAVPGPACIVIFSLSNEPWLKYSLALIADQGVEPDRWTSTRMRREVLYLENEQSRYELMASGAKGEYDTYTLSQVRTPHSMDRRATMAAGVPLPASAVSRLHTDLDWEEIVWGPCFMRVRGVEFPLSRALFMPHSVAK